MVGIPPVSLEYFNIAVDNDKAERLAKTAKLLQYKFIKLTRGKFSCQFVLYVTDFATEADAVANGLSDSTEKRDEYQHKRLEYLTRTLPDAPFNISM
jgi:hypothetical protein